ncbi:MAG: tRNA pseudouridine(38-40) synthase TruA [Gammaproteobacteria bacterium]|nr:tRNA pseudouridine(38-40) synthase TruA [Gammaproteobacteria bacterium]
MRIAAGVEYDGSNFSGWQCQKQGVRTVQGAVEGALSRVANQPVSVLCAGRTDAGVHATGQVIHFDTEVLRDERAWVFGANANLPKDVVLLWAKPVSEEFHARFSAQRRAYRYVIFTRHVRPTFLAYRVSWHHRELDVERMAEAGRALLGEHDFSSYRAIACQAKSPVRTLYKLEVSRQGPFIFIDLEANGFLHHMVRNIAGVLMAIGGGERSIGWSREVLAARDRTVGGVTAQPFGLYLTEVGYPAQFGLPALSHVPPVW